MAQNTTLFTIPKDSLIKCHNLIKDYKFNDFDIEYFDDTTTMFSMNSINFDNKYIFDEIKKIYSYSEIPFINIDNMTVQYTKYNIKDEYIIKPHKDNCQNTIIIYLDKDPNIKETFIVSDKEINGSDLWSHGGLIMTNELMHSGKYIGTGTREILCLFYD